MKISKKAFTLIELLVVISIIAVLMSILMPALGKVREQARATVCKTRLKDIGSTFRLYMQDNKGHLPSSWATIQEAAANKADGDCRWFVRIRNYYDLNRAGTNSVYDYNLFKCPTQEKWINKYKDGEGAAGIYGYNWYFTETDRRAQGSAVLAKRMWWKNPDGIKQPADVPLVADLDTSDPLAAGQEAKSGWRMGLSNPHPAAYAKGWMNNDTRSGRHDYYGPAPNHNTDCNFLMADNHVEARNVCKENQWPWIGTTPVEQQSGRAFHPTRNP